MKILVKRFILVIFICLLSLILCGCEEKSDNENLDIFIEKFYTYHPNGYETDPKWYSFSVTIVEQDWEEKIIKETAYKGNAELIFSNNFNATTSIMEMTITNTKEKENEKVLDSVDSIKYNSGNLFKEYKTFLINNEYNYKKTYFASNIDSCELHFDFNIDILMPNVIEGEERLRYIVDDNILRIVYSYDKEKVQIDEDSYYIKYTNETYTFSSEMKILSISRSESKSVYKNDVNVTNYKKSSNINFTTKYKVDVPTIADEIIDLDDVIIFGFSK